MSRPVEGSTLRLTSKGGLKERIDAVEAAYEFMLAYAAQGVTGEEASSSGTEIRVQLKRSDCALEGLASLLKAAVRKKRLGPAERYRAFIRVIEQDAGIARAAIRLVLAQRAISSQLVDNLNALIHLRALLTDLFLIDEVLTPDSSRFWPEDQYQPGAGQPSFDKQFLRDYLSSLSWPKSPPPPKLPADILARTSSPCWVSATRPTPP